MTTTPVDRERIRELVAELTRAGDVRRLRDIRDRLTRAAARRGRVGRMAPADRAALSDPAALMANLSPGYRRRPHLDVIGRAVAGFAARSYDRLLIREPPQTGKTVTAVVGGCLWWLARNPTNRVIVGSYNQGLAVDRGRDVRRLVDEHGRRYGLEIARGSASVSDWRLVTGGGVKSVGVGSGVTGSPGDLIVIDDPHKSRDEADSLRYRDRVSRWMSADILTRRSPGAPVMIIMTPWHHDDLSARVLADEGRLEDGGRWKVVDMPALCTDPARDPLGRALGDPLPHPKIDVDDTAAALAHWLDVRATLSAQDWSALCQLDPRPTEGALLQRSLMRERRCYMVGSPCHPCDPKPTRAAVAVDPSGGGRDTAGIVGGYLGTDGRLYITSDASGVMASEVWSRRACEVAVELDADRIVVETNFGGDLATLAIRTAWSALATERAGDPAWSRLCPRIVTVTARRNKRLRAEPIAQQWTEDRIRTAAYLPELEEEWCVWQHDSSQSPGRIDASVYLAYALLPVPRAGGSTIRRSPSGSLPTSGMGPLG